MKINEINRVHLGTGNRGEAALRVIQSAHSEAQTETDESERRMKRRREGERDGGNKAADTRRGREKQMKAEGMKKQSRGINLKGD